MKPKFTLCQDRLSSFRLHDCASGLATPLSRVSNLSLRIGIFPNYSEIISKCSQSLLRKCKPNWIFCPITIINNFFQGLIDGTLSNNFQITWICKDPVHSINFFCIFQFRPLQDFKLDHTVENIFYNQIRHKSLHLFIQLFKRLYFSSSILKVTDLNPLLPLTVFVIYVTSPNYLTHLDALEKIQKRFHKFFAFCTDGVSAIGFLNDLLLQRFHFHTSEHRIIIIWYIFIMANSEIYIVSRSFHAHW